MPSTKSFLKGASLLTSSQLVVAMCTFFRNVIVARMIGVEDFGIATIFALVVSLTEMSGSLEFDRILVQDNDGASDDMLASAHLLNFLKSTLVASIFLLVANPIARLFDLPDLVWAFQLLAIIPFIKGFVHFDYVVQQRKLNFLSTASVDAIPQLIAVSIAYPLAMWLGDYKVMLVIVIAQIAFSVAISHVVSSRPYRWKFEKSLIRKKLNFGWPLLINGLLMFFIFQGDKAIIGAQYSMEIVGWYGAAFALTLMPTLLFAKVSGFLLLPVLSRSKADADSFLSYGLLSMVFCSFVGVFFSVFFIVGGAAFIYLCYGEKYLPAATVIVWLGIMQAVRMLRIAPTTMATAQAHTKNAMYSNIVRSSALGLALVVAYHSWPVEWVAITGLIGEVLALGATLYLLRMPGGKAVYVKRILLQFLLGVIICSVVFWLVTDVNLDNLFLTLERLVYATMLGVGLAVVVALADFDCRMFLLNQYRNLKSKK